MLSSIISNAASSHIGPSEHTVNNKQYAIEAHQVHKSTDGVYSVFGTIFTASASVDSDV
jgi:carbonic anhydrase